MPIHIISPHGSNDADIPLLRFGMIGFNASQRQQIEEIVAALPAETAMWQPAVMAEADAWLVCGEKTRALSTPASTGIESLRILAGLPSERAVTLNLHQTDRPLAFSLPLHDLAMEPMFTFEAASVDSVQEALKQLELCLQSLRSQFTLGKQLIERETELKAATYHVLYGGKLLAVMDFTLWKIGMRPDADPQQLETALWEKRPTEARNIPGNFVMTSIAQLRWIYAHHTLRDVLPRRYRHSLIYLRQSPQVPLSWLTDSHLHLIHELSMRPASFENLTQRTELSYEQLTRGLASLFFAASLTTTPEKAARARAGKALQGPKLKHDASGSSQSIFNSTLADENGLSPAEDVTVAAQLRPE